MSNRPHEIRRRRFLQAAAATGAVTAYGLAVPGETALAAGGDAGPSQAPAARPGLAVRWSSATLEAIHLTLPGPPVVARQLAIVHTCMYDAWAAYDDTAVGTRLGATLRQPPNRRSPRNQAEAVSFAAYRGLVDLFPQPLLVAFFTALMRRLGYDPTDDRTSGATPAAVGNLAAQAVLEVRHTDGSNQLGNPPYSDTTGYQPANDPDHLVDPNRWQPLRVPQANGTSIVQKFICPHWGAVTPFALTSPAQFQPARPPARVDAPRYREQAQQILDYSAGLTDEQKVIAEYWADGPDTVLPPGHWCRLAQLVSARDRHRLDDDVVMFFALANALHDAGVACWYLKRLYDSVRPISAVHYLFQDQLVRGWSGPYQGTGSLPGRNWQPFQRLNFVTPPFAEYPSGHSTFSAAGAEVLRRFTGSDRFGASHVEPAGSSQVEPGLVPEDDVVLRWPTFSAAADEAGLSRRYGGIHFAQADVDARAMGRQVGAQAWQRVVRLRRGQPVE